MEGKKWKGWKNVCEIYTLHIHQSSILLRCFTEKWNILGWI